MEKLRLVGRASRLSMLQIERVKKKIESEFPGIETEIIPRSSRGDELQDRPLQLEEGSDFFTQDIFDVLANNEADIAVHSLKDMSGAHFFGKNYFAVTERDDVRDVAIFNANVKEKISKGENIIVGTCSPRREEMATVFLRKALPQLSEGFLVSTKPIRGNVDTRLRKLDDGEYDGIILATAGLNRLLSSEVDKEDIRRLLVGKLLMLLPLVECVPAPCQGAIVAEAHHSNERAIEILRRINDEELWSDCVSEKREAMNYGAGCLQKFGVTTIRFQQGKTIYAAGVNESGKWFNEWMDLPKVELNDPVVFNSAEYMGGFFEYEYDNSNPAIETPFVFVSNYKAVHNENWVRHLENKRVWASGSKTWFDLASKGVWVEGCADALGMESMKTVWSMPLLAFTDADVTVITNGRSAIEWQSKGWKSIGTYNTIEKKIEQLSQQIRESDLLFWTSYRQYEIYKNEIKGNAIHACASGETADFLKARGLSPVVFPTIKSFQQWKKSSTRSHNVA